MGLIQETTNDQGPFRAVTCPHCTAGHVHLVSTRKVLVFLPVDFSVKIECPGCHWSVPVDSDEIAMTRRLKKAGDEWAAGRLNDEQWRSAVENANLRLIRELGIEGETWICDGCGETSPLTFNVCWQCGQDNPTPLVAKTTDSSPEGEDDDRDDNDDDDKQS